MKKYGITFREAIWMPYRETTVEAHNMEEAFNKLYEEFKPKDAVIRDYITKNGNYYCTYKVKKWW